VRGRPDSNSHSNADADTHALGYTNTNTNCNSDPDTNSNSKPYSNARSALGADINSSARIDLYFVKRDFYMECWQRPDRLLASCRQLTRCLRYF